MRKTITVLLKNPSQPCAKWLLGLLLLLLGWGNVHAQTGQKRTITGLVTDDLNEPLISATVRIKGTDRGTITDTDGKFTLSLEATDKTLIISYIGMQTQEIALKGQMTHYNVQLRPDAEMLKEVVVTGYQTISKERATGSFAVVTPKALKGKLQTNIVARLEGQIAGMVQQGNKLLVRGISTLKGNTSPLIVVDGIPFEGEIESINPSLIENVTVLKDAAAASIYGARSANGVIVITTKSGTRDNKTTVQYDGSIRFRPRPDMDYLNLVNSEEMVKLQQIGFAHTTPNVNTRFSMNPVYELLYNHSKKQITDAELAAGLAKYSALDNRQQLKDFYSRTGILHQHNLSVSGGNNTNRYIASVDYQSNRGNERYASDEKIGFNLRNTSKFFEWMTADLAVSGSFSKSESDLGINSYRSFYVGQPSYYMLRDTDGNPLNILLNKSETELERLRSIGLNDETYSPITNRGKEVSTSNTDYYRIQFGLDFKLMEGLNLNLKYQTERTASKTRDLYDRSSYAVRSMVNNAAQYNSDTKDITYNVPLGGQLREIRGDNSSYTLRAQLNFLKHLDKHYITALAGAERRQVKRSYTQNYYMGYDDNSLGYAPVNARTLYDLTGTESLGGNFSWNYTDENRLYSKEDRYVSFYGNASYTYDYRYNLTGSIRMDQSNLFGTDPKYQYRPLWSVGASWYMKEEPFMKKVTWVDLLNIRLTYGIRGNVPKDAGPFLTLYAPKNSHWVPDFGSSIKNPPNSSLRWEKTKTTNIGIDFQLFGQRLQGSIDYYYKYTTDLLALRNADPTLGHDQLILNYGRMSNKGIELTLGGRIDFGELKWLPSMTYSYNKNKLLNVEESDVTPFNRTQGNASVEGYPMGALFHYRFAGLNNKGLPLFYTKTGKANETDPDNKVRNITSINDLAYAGTTIAPHAASLTNRFMYKNFELSFMFVYYGGHVMRGVGTTFGPGYLTENPTREMLNLWQKAGDEANPETVPGFIDASVSPDKHLHPWMASDRHTVKADYAKLRELSLSYSFDKKLISKLKMESCVLTLQLQNLWTWKANKHGYDPEAMGTYAYGWGVRQLPSPTTCTLGVSINF